MTAKWGPGWCEQRSEMLFPIYSVLAPSATAAIYSNLFLKIIFQIYWGLALSILLSIIVYHFFLIYSDSAAVSPYRSLRWTIDPQKHFKFASTAAFHLRLISDKHHRELTVSIWHSYFIFIFVVTRSCAALRATDLGLSGQDAFRGGAGITEKRHVGGVTTDIWDGGGGGAGITEKRDWHTRGHNWPFRCLD